MKKKSNKYLVFLGIGFELIALLVLAIIAGHQLKKYGYGTTTEASLILGAFLIWFVSLIVKLKK
jgi:O-antigen/teichoic acid export membrane protein